MPTIRPSTEADIPAIAALYAREVSTGTSSFEVVPPTPAEMAGRRAEVLGRGLPWLTLEDDGGAVIGYAYCNWFKPRPAYRFASEISIYLAPAAQRRGLGLALLGELASRAERAGQRKLIAVIGGSNNLGSIALHRSAGFRPAGVLHNCGWKFDQWLDVVLMEKTLGGGAATRPEPPAAV